MQDYNRNNIKKAKELRKNMTPWERKFWYAFLKNYPVRFQRQKCIGEYIVDFYCAKAHLIIELDGGGHYDDKQAEYDKKRTKDLENMGLDLKILRFSNLDIDNNFYEACSKIDRAVTERTDELRRQAKDSLVDK